MSAASPENTHGRVFSTRVVDADWRGEASAYIRAEYSRFRGAAKTLAKVAGASPRTVEAWLQSRSCPTEDNLFNLMLADRKFRKQMIKFTSEVVAYRKQKGIL